MKMKSLKVSQSTFHLKMCILLSSLTAVQSCLFRTSWNPFGSSEHSTKNSPTFGNLDTDKEVVSVVQQTFVKTWVEMGKLKFNCPRENGLFPDKLDCKKYYNCTNSKFSVQQCDTGMGFEPLAKSCVANESVPLCQRVQILPDYKCNGTGLKIYENHCDKFILCTEDAAYASTCNQGDLLDQKLMLCLPETEVNCTTSTNSKR